MKTSKTMNTHDKVYVVVYFEPYEGYDFTDHSEVFTTSADAKDYAAMLNDCSDWSYKARPWEDGKEGYTVVGVPFAK